MQNRIIIQEHKYKLLNIKEKVHKDVETRCRKWIDEDQMHQPKLVAAQTPLGVLNTILFYFFSFLLFFFEQELIVFSLSFDPYTSFLLTFVTNTARLSTKGAHKDQLRWMAQHKNKKLGWGICGG